jgi:hypothetical protein
MLDLKSNSIGENGAKHLREGIAKCSTLNSINLYLWGNGVGENGNRLLK